MPFAVIGADESLAPGSKAGAARRVRSYPWGAIDVENPDICDLGRLRTLLV